MDVRATDEAGDASQGLSSTSKGVLALAGVSLLLVSAISLLVAYRAVKRIMGLFTAASDQGAVKKKKGCKEAAAVDADPPAAQPSKTGGKPDLKTLIKESRKTQGGKGAAAKDEHASNHHLFINGLPGHADAVHSVCWSPDGTKIITACEDMNVRVFDLSGGASVRDPRFRRIACARTPVGAGFADARGDAVSVVMRGVPDTVMALLVRGDGKPKVLASGRVQKADGDDVDTQWQVENVHGREPCLAARGVPPSEHPLRGRRSGLVVSLSTKKDARVYSLQGKELATLEPASLGNHDLAVSLDGRFIAVASFTSEVKLWEVKVAKDTGTVISVTKAMELKGHKKKVMCVALSADNKRAVTASQDGTLRMWNVDVRYSQAEDPKTLLSIPMPLPGGRCYDRLAFGPGDILAASCGGLVHMLDAASGDLLDAIPDAHDGAGGVAAMQWCPVRLPLPGGGEPVAVLATCGRDKRARLWRAPL